MFLIVLSIVGVIGITGVGILNQPQFGKIPSGKRLERIEKSPNYKDGHFQNQEPTVTMTGDEGSFQALLHFLFKKYPNTVPDSGQIPAIRTNLKNLDRNKDLFVWFGHSSYLLQLSGKRILVDPVFYAGAPFEFINKPFPGTDIYKPEDMPDIDYLIISHDHYDHLEYRTVKELQPRIAQVVTGLGVGEDFEYWGFPEEKISELDWGDSLATGDGFKFHCLPARHFSGRSVFSQKTLWASFLVETPDGKKIFIGGDGGYGKHFQKLGEQFPDITLAILENGQYNKDWKLIHTLPEELEKETMELGAQHVVTVHHSKFKLSYHPWNEPTQNAKELQEKGIPVITPTIGEVVEIP